MILSQLIYNENREWEKISGEDILDPQLVLVFGTSEYIKTSAYSDLRAKFPHSDIVGCSTAGSIAGERVDDMNTATLVSFNNAHIKVLSKDFSSSKESAEVGSKLAGSFELSGLKHLFVLSDGTNINGSELADGLNSAIKENIHITGGLAGDGIDFNETYIIANDEAKSSRVVAIGFYGESLDINSGCFSGWNEFGAERYITKSKANILYEIDGKPALELYKSYLGDEAVELPASGLKFPISIRSTKDKKSVIRTLLGVNEEDNSLIFAGDVPEGYHCRLMKSNMDKLIDHAGLAAEEAKQSAEIPVELCIAVSCVGRRLVLSGLVEEEIDAIGEVLEKKSMITGFYSYGEIAPLDGFNSCSLHNQTATLTVIGERA